MSLFEKLARPSIVKLRAYRSARSIATEAKVFLDANEAPGASDFGLNRYPKPQPAELVERFAQIYGVATNKILIGRGSDEAIDILTRAFCEPAKDAVMITPPTYGMYEVSADIQNARVLTVPLRLDDGQWKLNIEAMIARADEAKLIYVCSPNNPTGTAFAPDQIRELCLGAKNSLVVVDEAYGEFAAEFSCIPLMEEFPRLVVLRTLSKAWALAGLRCGVALGHPELIALLQKVRAPYPLPKPVVDLALEALSPQGGGAMQNRVHDLVRERERLAKAFTNMPSVETVFPSHANFLLIRFKNEAAVMTASREAGIILRSRTSEPGLENCVRITIGTVEENDLLLSTLQRAGL
jgi:histidinol-phosphate aminotransferase